MRGWMVAIVGVAVAVVVVAVGVIVLVTAGGGTAIVDLRVGDCFDLPEQVTPELDEVDLVDCARPHLAEVVGVGSLNQGGQQTYPDDDAELFEIVDAACRRSSPVDSAEFGLLPIAPTPASWASFEGRYVCVAIPFGGAPVTGSIVAG